MRLLLILTSLALTSTCTEAATSEAWRDRVVYQILTDRFSAEANPGEACEDLRGFCGGTYKGLVSKLDYLQVKEEFLHGLKCRLKQLHKKEACGGRNLTCTH